MADNMKKIHVVSSRDIKKAVHKIAENFNPEKVILFGSYAHGKPSAESDVDLLVIKKVTKSNWETGAEISLMLKHSFPIDIIVKSPAELEKRIRRGDFFLKDILENGKVLYEKTR